MLYPSRAWHILSIRSKYCSFKFWSQIDVFAYLRPWHISLILRLSLCTLCQWNFILNANLDIYEVRKCRTLCVALPFMIMKALKLMKVNGLNVNNLTPKLIYALSGPYVHSFNMRCFIIIMTSFIVSGTCSCRKHIFNSSARSCFELTLEQLFPTNFKTVPLSASVLYVKLWNTMMDLSWPGHPGEVDCYLSKLGRERNSFESIMSFTFWRFSNDENDEIIDNLVIKMIWIWNEWRIKVISLDISDCFLCAYLCRIVKS
jgi:hypothetical protein